MAIRQKRVSHSTYIDADLPNQIQVLQFSLNQELSEKGGERKSIVDLECEAWRDLLKKHSKVIAKHSKL